MQRKNKRRLLFLGTFAIYFATLWILWPTIWVYPLKMFVVLLHEASHAIATWASGGLVERIVLDPREGGAAYARGGSPFLMLSAGYLGSLIWGLVLLWAARTSPARARSIAGALAIFTIAIAVAFIRGPFGFLFAATSGVLLFLAARKLPQGGLIILLTTLGLTSALYAILDIRDDILRRPHQPSDAFLLYELTGIPTLVWGALWGTLALLACAYVGRELYKRA